MSSAQQPPQRTLLQLVQSIGPRSDICTSDEHPRPADPQQWNGFQQFSAINRIGHEIVVRDYTVHGHKRSPEALYDGITGYGAESLAGCQKVREGGFVTLEIPKDAPRVPLAIDVDGNYIGVLRHKATGRLVLYGGTEFGRSGEILKARKAPLRTELQAMGYPDSEIERFLAMPSHDGLATRLFSDHSNAKYRHDHLASSRFYQLWGDDDFEVVGFFPAFLSRHSNDPFLKRILRALNVFGEHATIAMCGSISNPPFTSLVQKIATSFRIPKDHVPITGGYWTNIMSGLEENITRDHRTAFLLQGKPMLMSVKKRGIGKGKRQTEADKRCLLSGTADSIIGDVKLALPKEISDEVERIVLIQVSFNLAAAKQIYDALPGGQTISPFAPLLPILPDDGSPASPRAVLPEHAVVLLITGPDKDGQPRTFCLADCNDPGVNELDALERCHASLFLYLYDLSNKLAKQQAEEEKLMKAAQAGEAKLVAQKETAPMDTEAEATKSMADEPLA